MAERKMLPRKRRILNQQPIVRLKRTSDETSLPILKQCIHLFPFSSSGDAINCLKALLSPKDAEPDLTIISLILGALENALTEAGAKCQYAEESKALESMKFPSIKFDDVKSLYHKFQQNIKSQSSSTLSTDNVVSNEQTTNDRRSEVRLIADKVWMLLARSYKKDKLRMQYLYSLMKDQKLDSFGVTSSVVAACQLLDMKDVNMVVSEDHSWIEFGEANARESMEVTWHGKCTEDKRGSSISSTNKWIYLSEHPIVCTTRMTAALLTSQLNPSIEGDLKSPSIMSIKRELMWFLYHEGLLQNLPLALIELAKLEVAFYGMIPHSEDILGDNLNLPMNQSNGGVCFHLLQEAVKIGRDLYNNCLVYPHLELGEFFLKKNIGSKAFRAWADAADVISRYNYGKEDEEVYKRFYEIATESFNILLKKSLSEDVALTSNGHEASQDGSDESELPVFRNPRAFGYFLRFYDGMCCWEEDSPTPVLHVKWAQSMCTALLKFNNQMRIDDVIIKCDPDDDGTEDSRGKVEEAVSVKDCSTVMDCGSNANEGEESKPAKPPKKTETKRYECKQMERSSEQNLSEISPKPLKACNTHQPGSIAKRKRGYIEVEDFGKSERRNPINNENCKYPLFDDHNLNTFEEFRREISKKLGISRKLTNRESENPILEVLSKNCSNSIFNPEFFQGRGEPFLKSKNVQMFSESKTEKSLIHEQATPPKESIIDENHGRTDLIASNIDLKPINKLKSKDVFDIQEFKPIDEIVNSDSKTHKKIMVLLKSSKMKSLRDLLTLERLNTQAIKLQLTAQLNTIFNKNKVSLQKHAEHPDGVLGGGTSSAPPPQSVDGEVKIMRRALRNRVGK